MDEVFSLPVSPGYEDRFCKFSPAITPYFDFTISR